MSIQPSLSYSRNAQPGPTVSGMYISGDSPAVCVQVMPLLAPGISSKAETEAAFSGAWSEKSSSKGLALALTGAEENGTALKRVGASALVNPERPSSCSQRRREIIVARWWHSPELWRRLRAAVAFRARRFLCARCGRRRSPVDNGPRDLRERASHISRGAPRRRRIFARRPATCPARDRLRRIRSRYVRRLKNARRLHPIGPRGARF